MSDRRPWPDEDVEKLRDLWGKLHTAREISEAFGGKYTRNGVIGKCNRLGLTPHKPILVRKHRPKKEAAPKPPKPPEPTEPSPIGEPETFTAHGTCQYIYGDPSLPGWTMCGHPVVKFGCPWCEYHKSKVVDKNATQMLRKARLK